MSLDRIKGRIVFICDTCDDTLETGTSDEMPRKRNETQEQFMDRLRAVRGLPPMREDPRIMGRTRDAVGFINGVHGHNHEALKMAAFLDIFHPEVQGLQHLELMQSARAQDRRR